MAAGESDIFCCAQVHCPAEHGSLTAQLGLLVAGRGSTTCSVRFLLGRLLGPCRQAEPGLPSADP